MNDLTLDLEEVLQECLKEEEQEHIEKIEEGVKLGCLICLRLKEKQNE